MKLTLVNGISIYYFKRKRAKSSIQTRLLFEYIYRDSKICRSLTPDAKARILYFEMLEIKIVKEKAHMRGMLENQKGIVNILVIEIWLKIKRAIGQACSLVKTHEYIGKGRAKWKSHALTINLSVKLASIYEN
jgi:hypothetical protein